MKGNDISTQILGWTNHQGHNYRGKKIKTVSLAVQCNVGRMLCCDSLLLGGRSQSLGCCSHSGRTALSESSSYHMLVAELYCSNMGGQGLWLMIFFFSLYFCIFLRWAGKIWREVLMSQSMSHNVHSYMSSLEPRKWNESPAIKILLPIQVSKCEAKSHCIISGRKHILWGQLGTKLQLRNAFWRSPSSLQEDMEGPQGSLPLPRRGPYYHSPPCALSPSLLHWWVQLNEELKDKMQEKASRIMWLCLDALHQAAHSSLLHFSVWKNQKVLLRWEKAVSELKL